MVLNALLAPGGLVLFDRNNHKSNHHGALIQAGFSQTSQIHKKDRHIKRQKRYVNHKRLNNAFIMHASTSPFYPLFTALDVNAKMHAGESDKRLWMDCVKIGIETRKLLLSCCKLIRLFIPAMIDNRPWSDYDTNDIANDLYFFKFTPGERWHAFDSYAEN